MKCNRNFVLSYHWINPIGFEISSNLGTANQKVEQHETFFVGMIGPRFSTFYCCKSLFRCE